MDTKTLSSCDVHIISKLLGQEKNLTNQSCTCFYQFSGVTDDIYHIDSPKFDLVLSWGKHKLEITNPKFAAVHCKHVCSTPDPFNLSLICFQRLGGFSWEMFESMIFFTCVLIRTTIHPVYFQRTITRPFGKMIPNLGAGCSIHEQKWPGSSLSLSLRKLIWRSSRYLKKKYIYII